MTNDKITISEAIKKLETWFENKDYEKVLLGTKEILAIDPQNTEAQELIEKSQRMIDEQKKEKTDTLDTIGTFPEVSKPPQDALSTFLTNDTPKTSEIPKMPETPIQEKTHTPTEIPKPWENPETLHEEDASEKKHVIPIIFYLMKKIIIILVSIGITGGLVYGGFFLYQNYINPEKKEATVKEKKEEVIVEKTIEAQNNEQRTLDLKKLEKALEDYFLDKNEYPLAKKIEAALVEGVYIDGIPIDPRSGEKDENGNVFGYIYAVYSNASGENQEYIISALFENTNKEKNLIWSPNNTSKHEDFRSLENINTKFLETYVLGQEIIEEPMEEEITEPQEGMPPFQTSDKKVRRVP